MNDWLNRLKILDLLPDPVQLVDLSGRIVFMNIKMTELFGDIRGQLCFQAIKKSGQECKNCPRRAPTSNFVNRQVEIETANDRKMLVSHSVVVLDGDKYILECYKDITDYRRVVQEDARKSAELDLAKQVQDRCMTVQLAGAELDYDYRYLPARTVNGDFLNAILTNDGRVNILVADVSGHGIGAATITFMLKIVCDQLFLEHLPVEHFPEELNKRLYKYLCPDRFLTFAMVSIDRRSHSYRLVNAGHPPVLHLSTQSGKMELHKAQYPPLGILQKMPFDHEICDIPLEEGERLLLYSDGIFQMYDNSFEKFAEHVKSLNSPSVTELLKMLLPSEPAIIEDDITLFAIELRQKKKRLDRGKTLMNRESSADK